MEIRPLEQFEVHPVTALAEPLFALHIAGFDVSFTNSALWMAIAVVAIYLLMMAGTRQHAMVPGRLQSVVELLYEFVANVLRDAAGKEGMRYFPVIFTLFTFILFGNMLGLIPGSFTFTSHIIVTFAMAVCVIVAVTVLGFVLHGWRFLTFFVPHGAPKFMLPILVPIEV